MKDLARQLLDYFDYSELARRLRPFISAIAGGVTRVVLGNKIILYHPGAELRSYPADSAGLDQAITDAVSGDHIDLPGACTISGNHTIPAGVILGGRGGNAILTGMITLSANSGLRDLSVRPNGAGERVALIGPGSSSAFARDCYFAATSSDGTAYAVVGGDGDLVIADCTISAVGVFGVGVVLAGGGDVYLYGSQPVDGSDFILYVPVDLLNEYFFPADLQGWIEDLYSGTGAASDYSAVSWDAVQGKTDPGAVKCNLFAANSNDRSAGIKIFPSGKTVVEGDVFRAWFLLTDMTLSGVIPLEGSVQVYFTDGTNAYAYDRPILGGAWKDVTLTIGAGDAGKGVAYVIVFASTNGNTTGIMYIDDVLLPWAETYGEIYTNSPRMDTPEGIPLQGDRAVWDALAYPTRHANDIDVSAGLHHTIGTGAGQVSSGAHNHGTGTEDVLAAWSATSGGLKNSHLDDGISGAFLAQVAATLTGNRAYTLQDSDMTLAALNLAQTFTQNQRINANLGINTDPDSAADIHIVNDAAVPSIYLDGFGFASAVYGRRANGTIASPTSPGLGSALLSFVGRAWDGTSSYINVASYQVEVDGTPSGTDIPGRVRLLTHRQGDTAGATGGRWILFNMGDITHYPLHDTMDSVNAVNTTTQRVTSGTPAAGFGQRHLYQLRSSTTNDQDAGALDVVWSTATHASRTSRISLSPVVAAAMVERLRLADAVQVGDIAGGNYSEIENDGTLKFVGNATTWQDIDFPIIIRTTGTGIPTLVAINGNITMPQWAVNDYNICESQEFVHQWKEGSACSWHVHLTSNGLDATNRYVRFEVEYGWVVPNGAWTWAATLDSGDLLIPASTTDKTMFILALGSFTPSGGKIGGHVVARLKRIAATGTAPSNNPWVPMLQLHIECDTTGSRAMTTK